MSGIQKRKQARKHADFMQKVTKLTVFFGECNINATTEEQKNGKKGQGREEL